MKTTELKENLLNTKKIVLDFDIDEDCCDKIINCFVTNGEDDELFDTCLDFNKGNGDYGDDDYDEDDEDFDEESERSIPHITFQFMDDSLELYNLNKDFFDKYFESIGAELDEDESDEENVVFGFWIDKSPSIKTLREITKDLTSAMKGAELKSPFTHEEE